MGLTYVTTLMYGGSMGVNSFFDLLDNVKIKTPTGCSTSLDYSLKGKNYTLFRGRDQNLLLKTRNLAFLRDFSTLDMTVDLFRFGERAPQHLLVVYFT